MTPETWLLFCAMETVLSFTPGPAVMLVISVSLTRGARAGFGGSLGILAANVIYFALSATSLGAVLVASAKLFTVIKWLGAAYLVLVGARMILFPSREVPASPASQQPGSNAFWYGFVTQVANPKALVFFTALLPQFISPQEPVAIQIAILGISSILIELVVLSIYVAACYRARAWANNSRFATHMQRAGGMLLVGAGAGLAAIRQN